jgi:hypothetical protein
MKNHTRYEDLLPMYAAGKLGSAERTEVEAHLLGCAACRADLELWSTVAVEVRLSSRAAAASPDLAARALAQIHTSSPQPVRGGLTKAWRSAWQLLRAQVFLVEREMWPASAAVMLMGAIVALISNHIEAMYYVAPLVAAASLTVLFGPAHDPAYELMLSTPTSPWRMLLARLSIVSVYNLILALAAGLILLAIVPAGLLGALILGWLAPMAFLSALALLLSLWIGTGNAVTISYSLWFLQFLPYRYFSQVLNSAALEPFFSAYQSFWRSPLLLGSLALLLIACALASAGRPLFGAQSETA